MGLGRAQQDVDAAFGEMEVKRIQVRFGTDRLGHLFQFQGHAVSSLHF